MASQAYNFRVILSLCAARIIEVFYGKNTLLFLPSHSSKPGNTDDMSSEDQFSNTVMFSFSIWQSKINTKLLNPGSSQAFFLNAVDQVRFPI